MKLRIALAPLTVAVTMALGAAMPTTASAIDLCPTPGPSGSCDRVALSATFDRTNWGNYTTNRVTASNRSVIGIRIDTMNGGKDGYAKIRLTSCDGLVKIISESPIALSDSTGTKATAGKIKMATSSTNCFRLSIHGYNGTTKLSGTLVYPAA